MKTAVAAVDAANHIWAILVKAERSHAGCCKSNLWSLQEPPVKTWNLVVEWTDGWSLYNRMCAHSKFYNILNKGGKMTEAKEPKTAYIDVKVWGREGGIYHSMYRWWQCFLYCQTYGLHELGHCWCELCTQWCWWACTQWQRQDEGVD